MKEKEFGGIPGRRGMILKKDKADLKRTGIKQGFPHELPFSKDYSGHKKDR